MRLLTLKLTQFKNYTSQGLQLAPRINCFVGKNGMGKTNLLDAIYYLCMCKSQQSLSDAHLTLHGEAFFRLEGHFYKNQKRYRIVAKVQARKRKVIECNDVAYPKLIDHIGLLPVVMIVPDDTRLATEGSEDRRRFLNNTLSQLDPRYLRDLVQYNRLLKQRNAALKQMGAERRFDAALLATYDEQLLAPATYLHQQRAAFQTQLVPALQAHYAAISGGQEQVSCTYRSALSESNLADLLVAAREKDRILQRTTVGIHRDDLLFQIGEYPLKKYASQGQLKSFVLALKLAQYAILRGEKKESPLLLLDDIFDKLDPSRVRQLIELLIEQEFGQVFITDTDEHRLASILNQFTVDYRKFRVAQGQIIDAAPDEKAQ
ncbi:MAG: DNA replication/repair protein RecF [Bacteroidota bacterium]